MSVAFFSLIMLKSVLAAVALTATLASSASANIRQTRLDNDAARERAGRVCDSIQLFETHNSPVHGPAGLWINGDKVMTTGWEVDHKTFIPNCWIKEIGRLDSDIVDEIEGYTFHYYQSGENIGRCQQWKGGRVYCQDDFATPKDR